MPSFRHIVILTLLAASGVSSAVVPRTTRGLTRSGVASGGPAGGLPERGGPCLYSYRLDLRHVFSSIQTDHFGREVSNLPSSRRIRAHDDSSEIGTDVSVDADVSDSDHGAWLYTHCLDL